MSSAITCINKRFAVKDSGISCLALIFNPRTTILHENNWLKVARYDESCSIFFWRLIRTHGLVVMASTSESGDMGTIPIGC